MLISIITIRRYFRPGWREKGQKSGLGLGWDHGERGKDWVRTTTHPQYSHPKPSGGWAQCANAWPRMLLWGLALLLSWLGVALPSWAVGDPASAATETIPSLSAKSQPDASAVPSETVSRFVSAYLEVVKLIESREQSLQSAETETESLQMQQEIQAEAVALIQSHDLTLPAYWELLGLANSDPEFRERVLAQMEEARF